MDYILNTDKGFVHHNVFFHNINDAEIIRFDSAGKASDYGSRLIEKKSIKSYKIENIAEQENIFIDLLDVKLETFLCAKLFIDLLSIKKHGGKFIAETEFSSDLYEFKSKTDFIKCLNDKTLLDKFKLSKYNRELFYIPNAFWNDNKWLYENEEDGTLIIVNRERFYLTGGCIN